MRTTRCQVEASPVANGWHRPAAAEDGVAVLLVRNGRLVLVLRIGGLEVSLRSGRRSRRLLKVVGGGHRQ
eukprot:2876702-Heterocapsa_arctica.AAC.1